VLGLALSVTVRVPVREPVAVGVKVTLMVHDELAARLEPQVLVCEKSPLAVMLEIVSAAPPVLERVTAWGLLPVATNCGENVKEVVERLAAAAVPVPDKVALRVAGLALSVTVTEPVTEPVAVGVKVTLMVHDELAARLEPQVLVCEKLLLMAMLEIASAELPALESVRV